MAKELITDKFDLLNNLFKDVINAIEEDKFSNGTLLCAQPNKIISATSQNNYDTIISTKETVGIYLFLNSDGLPTYIGKGGTSRSSNGKDLYFRLQQELGSGNKHNTLSNNIKEISNVSEEQSLELIKSFTLKILILGNRTNSSENINKEIILKSEAIETLLIALFDPVYNK